MEKKFDQVMVYSRKKFNVMIKYKFAFLNSCLRNVLRIAQILNFGVMLKKTYIYIYINLI